MQEPQQIPTEGPELSNFVTDIIVRFCHSLEAKGADKETFSDALVMAAIASSVECRGVGYVVAELRKLAAMFEASAPKIDAAMQAAEIDAASKH